MCGGGGGWRNRSNSSNSGGEQDGGGPGFSPQEDETQADQQQTEEECIFSETTELDSPSYDAVNDAEIGEILSVEVRGDRPCVVDSEDRILGTITGVLGTRILDCIENGFQYRAEIIEKEGRNCQVRISNKCIVNEVATLASPNPGPLSRVSEGDVLPVEVRDESLCVVDEDDEIVGPVAEPWTEALIECINSGFDYEAEITDIDGGSCEVRIQTVVDE